MQAGWPFLFGHGLATAFRIDRSIGGMLVLDGFATHCSVSVLNAQRGCPGDRARPQREADLRSRMKRLPNRTTEKIRKNISKKLTGPERVTRDAGATSCRNLRTVGQGSKR